jgi:hypothetical protein
MHPSTFIMIFWLSTVTVLRILFLIKAIASRGRLSFTRTLMHFVLSSSMHPIQRKGVFADYAAAMKFLTP